MTRQEYISQELDKRYKKIEDLIVQALCDGYEFDQISIVSEVGKPFDAALHLEGAPRQAAV